MKVWHIDSSAREEGSISRKISKQFVDSLASKQTIETKFLNVGAGLPFLTEAMVESYFTPDEQRTDAQKLVLSESNNIVKTAKESDVWVMGIPIYNFSAPAAFKAFIDLLLRAKETFTYTENGPVGLLENKKVFVVVASGGVEIGSDYDFLTPWLIHCLHFIGVKDIQFINADKYSEQSDPKITQQIEQMTDAVVSKR